VPRAKSRSYNSSGPTDEDLAAFESALASLLPTAQLLPLPGDLLSKITHEAGRRGYSLTVSPTLGGRAWRLRVPFGEKALEVYTSDTENVGQLLTGLLAAVGKLPTRSST
jgi:hypothetical protein